MGVTGWAGSHFGTTQAELEAAPSPGQIVKDPIIILQIMYLVVGYPIKVTQSIISRFGTKVGTQSIQNMQRGECGQKAVGLGPDLRLGGGPGED